MIGSVYSPLCFKPKGLSLKFTKNEQFLPDLRRLSSACSAAAPVSASGMESFPSCALQRAQGCFFRKLNSSFSAPKAVDSFREMCVCAEISCYDKKKKTTEFSPVFPFQQAVKTSPLLNFLFFSSIYFSHSVSLLFLSLPISSLKYYIPSLFFLCVF